MKEEYVELSQQLSDLAESVKTPKERLELVFYDEYFSIRNNIKEVLEGIIGEYNDWESFFNDFILCSFMKHYGNHFNIFV